MDDVTPLLSQAEKAKAMTAMMGKDADDIPDIDLDNLDDLLHALSAEELEELNGDFDPDNSLLPPDQRCRNQTEKNPTGKFKRQELLEFLEKKAKTEKDWEQNKPYVKEEKGTKFVAKQQEKTVINDGDDDGATETEWDEILTAASEEELVDLAAVLGFHSMLTQTQFYASLRDEECNEGGFTGAAKAQELKLVPDEAPNATNVEESIKQLKANDPKLKVLNLNNIKNVSTERLCQVCEALKDNTVVIHFHMAGVVAKDSVAKKLAESIAANKTLKTVNVESNFITGEAILELVKAVNVNQSIIELRVANQKPSLLGNKAEMAISKLMQENKTLLRLGIEFEYPEPRIRTTEMLKKNFDELRKQRVSK